MPDAFKIILLFLAGAFTCIIILVNQYKFDSPTETFPGTELKTSSEKPLADDDHNTKIEALKKKSIYHFHDRTKILTWMVLIVFLSGFSFAASPLVKRELNRLTTIFKLPSSSLWIRVILALLFFVSAFVFSGGYWLYLFKGAGNKIQNFWLVMDHFGIFFKSPTWTSISVTLVSSIATLLALMGMISLMQVAQVMSTQTKSLKPSNDHDSNLEDLIKKFKLIDHCLMVFLTVLSVSVAGGVITAVFNREAVLEVLHEHVYIENFLLPEQFIVLYGFSFSVFLFLIYFPTRMVLKVQGRRVLEEISFENIDGEREQFLNKLFKLEHSGTRIASTGIFILSPLISAFVNNIFSFL